MISIIVPTLNEEDALGTFLDSLERQSWTQFEVIIVDGGSKDQTSDIARKHGAKVIVEPECAEFPSRNIGAEKAEGDILLFTCADVMFPSHLLTRVQRKFTEDSRLVALSGPGIPVDAPLIGRIEYELYDMLRYFLTKLPTRLKRFSTSTNFLAVRKSTFEQTGRFRPHDVNADGIMGKQLTNMGRVDFAFDTFVCISARRMRNMGFMGFNRHYLYVLENFLPGLSNTTFIRRIKRKSGNVHKRMHE